MLVTTKKTVIFALIAFRCINFIIRCFFSDENKENLSDDMSETSESVLKTQNALREGSALGESTPGKDARRELIKDEDSFSDPVYREISRKNGFLNKQDLSTLKRICKVKLKTFKKGNLKNSSEVSKTIGLQTSLSKFVTILHNSIQSLCFHKIITF